MTSKLKCPFCGEELEYWNESTYQVLGCRCMPFPPLTGNERMWQALIQAKQDLEIAVDALKRIKEPTAWGTLYQEQEIATDAFEQITALEQESNN